MQSLSQYKAEITALGRTTEERKFLAGAFTRWYIQAPKRGVLPQADILSSEDLRYAKQHHFPNMNVAAIEAGARAAFRRLKQVRPVETTPEFSRMSKLVHPEQVKRLRRLYTGTDFERDAARLIELYAFIGINNMHLGIPPIVDGVELFGSPLNTHSSEYCSPFEMERAFGSRGSFFEYQPHRSGVYLCNPPFDDPIMTRMARRLLELLAASAHDLVVIVTLPVWDSDTQRRLKLRDFGLEFEAFERLRNSTFCKRHQVLDRDQFAYFDYYRQKRAPASHTHLLVLSNARDWKRMLDYDRFVREWKAFAAKRGGVRRVTKVDLLAEARRLQLRGYSQLRKAELENLINRNRRRNP